MAAGSHIGFDLGNIRPPMKCYCWPQLDPQIDPIYSFEDIVIFIFCSFGLKLAYFPQIWPSIVPTLKRTILARKHVV